MGLVSSVLLTNLLAYFINLASNERSSAIGAARQKRLNDALNDEEALREALASTKSIRDEVRGACVELARNGSALGITAEEQPLWRLLSDEVFQESVCDWLMAGAIEEGNAAKNRIVETMERALDDRASRPEQITFLRTEYFDRLEKAVFAHPILARWRHQLSLDYLREQVARLRQLAEEAAGSYSIAKQDEALAHYCEAALQAWDIIDLSNLPEGDIHITTQKLLLRQLYMPLRVEFQRSKEDDHDAALARLEVERETRRHREAGHALTDDGDKRLRERDRAHVGELLDSFQRLVVLGDPGAGKTTMLRWMATAYLLMRQGGDASGKIPDTETLPRRPWIPVLIRCRDLGEDDLCGSFIDFLTQHLNKSVLQPQDAQVMRAVILDRIAKGEALLLVDGLDEIANTHVRIMFCQELERTGMRYPLAAIVVTSRIVGYRDMPYRIGPTFKHGAVAELNRGDKDRFAESWVEVTEQHQSVPERSRRTQELIDALHSTDRIERLTGNPLLLTTLALVKRKVGKLPNRRPKLYAEAVSVLLNWNPRLYETIDDDEAIPQLEYLAFEMCRRGVQRLAEDEVLDLLEGIRNDYPNVRAIRRRGAADFLTLLEARSSILIKSGGIWQQNEAKEKPAWEFRHLTFQEYLAARALIDGRFRGRDKAQSLAEQVAPLAGSLESTQSTGVRPGSRDDLQVLESWREALRLVAADCKDDEVDDVLKAILTPGPEEDMAKTARPRAILAALCLADEPNISEGAARHALDIFASVIGENDGAGHLRTPLDRAAVDVASSIWSSVLKEVLVSEFFRPGSGARSRPGGVWGTAELTSWKRAGRDWTALIDGLEARIRSDNRTERMAAAFTIMAGGFQRDIEEVNRFAEPLVDLLAARDLPQAAAASWALGWLCSHARDSDLRRLRGDHVNRMLEAIEAAKQGEAFARGWLLRAIGYIGDRTATIPLTRYLDDTDGGIREHAVDALSRLNDSRAVPALIARLGDPDSGVRGKVVSALGALGDNRAVPALMARLDDPDSDVRGQVVSALGALGDDRAVPALLAKLDDNEVDVRRSVVEALGHLGDTQVVPPLRAKLDDPNTGVAIESAAALGVLGDSRGTAALAIFANSAERDIREAAVRAYGRARDHNHRVLLSRDFDDAFPWLDPLEPITERHVAIAASRLETTDTEVRSRYESMEHDLGLQLSWKQPTTRCE